MPIYYAKKDLPDGGKIGDKLIKNFMDDYYYVQDRFIYNGLMPYPEHWVEDNPEWFSVKQF